MLLCECSCCAVPVGSGRSDLAPSRCLTAPSSSSPHCACTSPSANTSPWRLSPETGGVRLVPSSLPTCQRVLLEQAQSTVRRATCRGTVVVTGKSAYGSVCPAITMTPKTLSKTGCGYTGSIYCQSPFGFHLEARMLGSIITTYKYKKKQNNRTLFCQQSPGFESLDTARPTFTSMFPRRTMMYSPCCSNTAYVVSLM